MDQEQSLELFHKSVKEVEETGKFDAYPEMKRLMPLLEPLLKFDPAPPFPFTPLSTGSFQALVTL